MNRFLNSFLVGSMLLSSAATMTIGCKGKAGGAAATSAATKAASKLPKTGLQIDAPGELDISDAMVGDGDMVTSAELGALNIVISTKPKTIDEAKTEASAFAPKDLVAQALPDGWAVTYSNTGSAGANFFVTVRRDIGGKSFECSAVANSAERGKNALAACKSLRP